jgi:hypothetical protein
MKSIIFAIFLSLFVSGVQAFEAPMGPSVSVGITQFTPHGDDVWYQKGGADFPYTLHMRSPSYSVRYDWKLSEKYSVALSYIDFGRVTSEAVAVALDGQVPGDGGYNATTHSCNGTCWPKSHWYGKGGVKGLFAIVDKHWGKFSVGLGFGIYKPEWQENIPDWIQTRDAVPQNLTVVHNAKLQVTPLLEARYQVSDHFSILGTVVHTASEGDQWTSLYHNGTYMIHAVYTW